MSRSLIYTILFLLLGALAGCMTSEPIPAEAVSVVVPARTSGLATQAWLNLQERVTELTPEEVNLELEGLIRPEDGPELFYFGLLNQQSQVYEGWIQARDAFRNLRNDATLEAEQRQLAGILEVYNQQRINWYQLYLELQGNNAELHQALNAAQLEKEQLQQKIQALTELEAQISTRKEQ